MPAGRIVNASPLILLAKAGLLELLQGTGIEVIVPDAVVAEVVAPGEDDPAAQALRGASWIVVEPAPNVPAEVAAWDLGSGESAVIALALQRPGSEVVLDDRAARRLARRLGLPHLGTVGLILEAKRNGSISSARVALEALRRSGLYLTDDLIAQALGLVGE